MTGLLFLAYSRDASGALDASKLKQSSAAVDAWWPGAIAACRREPNALFIDVTGKEGDLMRRLANTG